MSEESSKSKYPPGFYEACDGERIAGLTAIGYRVVESYEVEEKVMLADHRASAQESALMPPRMHSGGTPVVGIDRNGNNIYAGSHEALAKSRRFLVHLDEHSAIEQLTKKKDALVKEINRLGDELRAAKSSLDAANKKAASAESIVSGLRGEVAKSDELVQRTLAAKDRLERDLGLVREAIGTHRFAEIVGGKKDNERGKKGPGER